MKKKRMVVERTMKKMLFLTIMSLCATAVFCLDIIVMKNGDEVEAVIKEIGLNEVKYTKSSNPDGPVYTVLKSAIFQIKYENGTREMFPEAGKNTPAAHENFTGGGYTTDPNYPYNTTYEPPTYEWVNDQKALDDGIAMTVIGGILLTGNGIFNIVRSATYNKPAPTLAGGFDPSGMQIALLPGNKVGLFLYDAFLNKTSINN
jgi:hypothetical protein